MPGIQSFLEVERVEAVLLTAQKNKERVRESRDISMSLNDQTVEVLFFLFLLLLRLLLIAFCSWFHILLLVRGIYRSPVVSLKLFAVVQPKRVSTSSSSDSDFLLSLSLSIDSSHYVSLSVIGWIDRPSDDPGWSRTSASCWRDQRSASTVHLLRIPSETVSTAAAPNAVTLSSQKESQRQQLFQRSSISLQHCFIKNSGQSM